MSDKNYYPPNVLKFCPRCGSKNFKSTSNKSFICDDCEFPFFTNAAAAVAGIIENDKGEILLTVRGREPKKGTLDLPGGFVDPGETAEEALIREIKEELHIDVKIKKYFSTFCNEYLYGGLVYSTLDMVFTCHAEDFSGIKADEDVADFIFKSKADINIVDFGLTSIKKVMFHYLNVFQQ
jgi:mutator protein MutT